MLPAHKPTSSGLRPLIDMLSDAEQLSQIDAEVAALQDNIRQLYNKRNRFIPISRLPPEMLSRVFLYLQDLCILNAHSLNTRKLQPLKLAWIVTTHVCRQWRDVAFEFPELWANIDMSFTAPWSEIFLERSKAAPLAVTIPPFLEEDAQKNTALRVLEQPQRLQVLKVSGHPLSPISQAMELLHSLSGVYMPILQSMVLDFENPYDGNMISKTPILPGGLCNGGTPVLRHLELRGCSILWTSPIFDNLTSLTMTRAIFGPQGSFTNFLDALERMSNIQEIDICIAVPTGTPSVASHTTVAFHKLKKFALKTSLPGCVAILNHVALPNFASLDLEVRNPGSNQLNPPHANAASSDFASAINTAWLATTIFPPLAATTLKPFICALEITPVLKTGIGDKARFWFEAIDLARRPIYLTKDKRRVVAPPPPAPMTITFTPSTSIAIDFTLIATLPIQNLQSIDLGISIDRWVWGTLAVLPSLQSIALNDETAPSFLTYVYSDPAMVSWSTQPPRKGKQTAKVKIGARTAKFKFRHLNRPSYHHGKLISKKVKETSGVAPLSYSPSMPIYFPNLAHLAFTGVDFELEEDFCPGEGSSIHWDRFLDFLLFRRESRKPIQFVRALTCINLMKPDVASIKTVVPTVEWDGIEERRDDYDLEEDWDASHDSDDCEGQCEEHVYRLRGHYGSSLLAAAFSF